MRLRTMPLIIVISLIPIAIAINFAIGLFGETWSPADWGSNIIFALVITAATIFLGERQQQLQKAVADAELVEKIASVVGNLDRVLDNCESSALHEILLNARSGFQLIPFADEASRKDYYHSLDRVLTKALKYLCDSTRPTSRWREGDWELIYRASKALLTDSESLLPRKDRRANLSEDLVETVGKLCEMSCVRKEEKRSLSDDAFKALSFDALGTPADEERDLGEPDEEIDDGRKYLSIPWRAFEASFRRGDQNQRVQARLKWSKLAEKWRSKEADIQRRHWWSETFFERNEIYSVWWIDSTGQFSRHDSEGVRPILLNEIDEHFGALPLESQETILEMSKWLGHRQNSALPSVEVVTLQVGDSALLVLDGNHRLAALKHKRPRKPRISASLAEYRIVLKSGIDQSLLADLRQYPRQ